MPSIVTLVIYIGALEAADPASAALSQSAREVLGDQARITIRTEDSRISDAALARAQPTSDAVAQITWLGTEHREASVHCYIAKTQRFVARDLTFDGDARPKDRERMLGFVIATMLPDDAEKGAEADAPAALPPKPNPHPARAPNSNESEAVPPPSTFEQSRFVGMAEVLGLGATGLGGSAGGFGAEVAGRWLFDRSLSLRMSGGLRRGEIPEASAISEVEFLGLGLALEAPIRPGSPFAFGGRVSALVLRHEVDHLSSDDREPDRKSRFLPGADAVFEACWHLSASAAFVAGAGSELAFGHTDVLVKGQEVTEIPPLRALAELGIQAKF